MAIEVGTAYLSVLPSTDKLAPAIKKELGQVDGREPGRRIGEGMAVGISKPIAALGGTALLGGVFKGAINEASNLTESINAVRVSYGDAASGIEALSRNSARALGLSESQMNAISVQFSAFAERIAGDGGDIAGTVEDIAQRGADFASVMNLDVNEALRLFQSGLSGEMEPLRRYGIDLSAATVELYAIESGLIAAGEQMTEQQKIQARYGSLMEQTSKVQGDFANTSDDLANSSRILSAEWDNLEADLGAKLIPAAEKGVTVTRALFGALDDVPGPVYKIAGGLGALALAKHVGLFDKMNGAVRRTGSGVDTMRLKMMLAGDQFRRTRRQSGLATASIQSLGATARVAGSRLKAGLGGAVGALGGPWGLAIAGATTAIALFASKSAEAKQETRELKDSLDQQTGAITKNTREWAANALQGDNVYKSAKALGIELALVTEAALGNTDAQRALNRALDDAAVALEGADPSLLTDEQTRLAVNIDRVRDAVGGTSGKITELGRELRETAEGSAEWTGATEDAAEATEDHTTAIRKNLEALAERHDKMLGNIDTEVAYHQSLADAREEMNKGRRTMDLTTQAGRDNREALNDLIGASNELIATGRVSEKQHRDMRRELIEVADGMGYTEQEAKRYIERLLDVPKTVATDAKFEAKKAKGDTDDYVRFVNRTLDKVKDRRITLDVIAKAARRNKIESDWGPSGLGGGGSIPSATTSSGGFGGKSSDAILEAVLDGKMDKKAITDAIHGAAKGQITAADFGTMGPAGRVLPKGSYRIGMPFMGYTGHYGADYPAPIGTPVRSPWAGRVTASYDLPGSNPYNSTPYRSYGRVVKVAHANGAESLFAHLSKRLASVGQSVRAGQQIGAVGTTGNSTGPHLHYEHRRNGQIVNPATLGIFDNGGVLEPGAIAVNLSRKPEAVYNHRQFQQFADAAVGADRPRRTEMVITNWKTGEGYLREIAGDTYSGERSYAATTARMGGRR